MFLKLRIFFTILSALCVAAIVPLGGLLGWGYAAWGLLGAFLFFGLMLLCKQSQESQEEKEKKEEPPVTEIDENGQEKNK